MALEKKKKSEPALLRLSAKELLIIKKDFGLTATELAYLLTLGKRYRKNVKILIKKLILN